MSTIRNDIEGVVLAHANGGAHVLLGAGDTVPKGYTVGDHVLDGAAEGGEVDPVDYSKMKVDDLRDLIEQRNEGRADEDLIPDTGNKGDLVAALQLDDESNDES